MRVPGTILGGLALLFVLSLAAFRATKITDRLEQGVPLEDVQRLADAAR